MAFGGCSSLKQNTLNNRGNDTRMLSQTPMQNVEEFARAIWNDSHAFHMLFASAQPNEQQ